MLVDRRSPEATAVYRTLISFTERRVAAVAQGRCRGLLSEADQEEILGEVVFQLMEGALGRFRGDTMAELLAYVRTMCDRTAVRRAQRRLRERDTLGVLSDEGAEAWHPTGARRPDEAVEVEAHSPLDEADRTYLEALVHAGSKAELARREGVSRAAVTQRVGRILSRVDALPTQERASHEAWLHQVATDALVEDRGGG